MQGTAAMGRKTRRGLVVAREPSGRLQRSPARERDDREISPTEVRRLRDGALNGLRDPEWGSELGRLYLERAISGREYAAGKTWRAQVARFQGSIGIFPVRSLSGEPTGRAEPPDPESDEGQKQAVKDRDAAETFFEAHTVLLWSGRGAESAVRRLCEEDQAMVGYNELQHARCGLTRLANYYELTRARK